jgi:hypothetical protein
MVEKTKELIIDIFMLSMMDIIGNIFVENFSLTCNECIFK